MRHIEKIGDYFWILRSHIGEKWGARIYIEIRKWEPIFCASERWEPDFKILKEPDLLKIKEPDYYVKIQNEEPVFNFFHDKIWNCEPIFN